MRAFLFLGQGPLHFFLLDIQRPASHHLLWCWGATFFTGSGDPSGYVLCIFCWIHGCNINQCSKVIQLLSAVKLAVTYYINTSDTMFLCHSLGEVRYSAVVQPMIIIISARFILKYDNDTVGTSIHHIPLATCTSLMHALASTTSSPRGSTG